MLKSKRSKLLQGEEQLESLVNSQEKDIEKGKKRTEKQSQFKESYMKKQESWKK